jgi:hypothetical protein
MDCTSAQVANGQRSDLGGSLHPVPIPLDCPGSLLPVSGFTPGVDKVHCDFCGRDVFIRPPPPDGLRDPWPGDKRPRVNAHWSNPMKSPPGN